MFSRSTKDVRSSAGLTRRLPSGGVVACLVAILHIAVMVQGIAIEDVCKPLTTSGSLDVIGGGLSNTVVSERLTFTAFNENAKNKSGGSHVQVLILPGTCHVRLTRVNVHVLGNCSIEATVAGNKIPLGIIVGGTFSKEHSWNISSVINGTKTALANKHVRIVVTYKPTNWTANATDTCKIRTRSDPENGLTIIAEDIDECRNNPCPGSQVCYNTIGGYRCGEECPEHTTLIYRTRSQVPGLAAFPREKICVMNTCVDRCCKNLTGSVCHTAERCLWLPAENQTVDCTLQDHLQFCPTNASAVASNRLPSELKRNATSSAVCVVDECLSRQLPNQTLPYCTWNLTPTITVTCVCKDVTGSPASEPPTYANMCTTDSCATPGSCHPQARIFACVDRPVHVCPNGTLSISSVTIRGDYWNLPGGVLCVEEACAHHCDGGGWNNTLESAGRNSCSVAWTVTGIVANCSLYTDATTTQSGSQTTAGHNITVYIVIASVFCVLVIIVVAVVAKKFHDGKLSVSMLAYYLQCNRVKKRGRPRGYSVSRDFKRNTTVLRQKRRETEVIDEDLLSRVMARERAKELAEDGDVAAPSGESQTVVTTNSALACDGEAVSMTSLHQTDVSTCNSSTALVRASPSLGMAESPPTLEHGPLPNTRTTPAAEIIPVESASDTAPTSESCGHDDYNDESPYSTPFEVLSQAIHSLTESASNETTGKEAVSKVISLPLNRSSLKSLTLLEADDVSTNADVDYSTPFEARAMTASWKRSNSERNSAASSPSNLTPPSQHLGATQRSLKGRPRATSSAATCDSPQSDTSNPDVPVQRARAASGSNMTASRSAMVAKPIPYRMYKMKSNLTITARESPAATTATPLDDSSPASSMQTMIEPCTDSGYAPISNFSAKTQDKSNDQQPVTSSLTSSTKPRLVPSEDDVYSVPMPKPQRQQHRDRSGSQTMEVVCVSASGHQGNDVYAEVKKTRRNTAPSNMRRPNKGKATPAIGTDGPNTGRDRSNGDANPPIIYVTKETDH